MFEVTLCDPSPFLTVLIVNECLNMLTACFLLCRNPGCVCFTPSGPHTTLPRSAGLPQYADTSCSFYFSISVFITSENSTTISLESYEDNQFVHWPLCSLRVPGDMYVSLCALRPHALKKGLCINSHPKFIHPFPGGWLIANSGDSILDTQEVRS